jgi:hypothetical protein
VVIAERASAGWQRSAQCTELLSGPDCTRGEEPRQLLGRALSYLPEGHGEVSARFESGFYRIDLLADCRQLGVRFSLSAPRLSAMWSALERIADDAWEPAEGLRTPRSPRPLTLPTAGGTSR